MGQGYASSRQPEVTQPQEVPSYAPDGVQPYGNAAAIDALGADATGATEPARRVGQAHGMVARLLEEAAGSGPLATIASGDGQRGDLSGVDWYEGLSEVDEVPGALREIGAPDLVQEAIWFLYEAAGQDPDPKRQRVYDLGTGELRSEPIPAGVDPISVAIGSNMVPAHLTANQDILDNKGPGPFPWSKDVDPVEGTTHPSFGRTVDDAVAARSTLKAQFRFDPSDRSLAAVRAMRGQLGRDQYQPFVDAYLTAFFVNGAPQGGGLHYELGSMGPVDTFFGSPPGCDQLPDGRGIIDCKGFSAVSELLLAELAGSLNEAGDDDVSLPFTMPHHQMVLLKSGNEVMVVDNDDVVPLNVSDGEVAELDRLAQSRFDGPGCREGQHSLSGAIDLGALPALGVFIEHIRTKYAMPPDAQPHWYDALEVSHA